MTQDTAAARVAACKALVERLRAYGAWLVHQVGADLAPEENDLLIAITDVEEAFTFQAQEIERLEKLNDVLLRGSCQKDFSQRTEAKSNG